MSIETRLRAELAAWADELEPDAGPDVTAASFTDLHHRRLRHRAALLAAAVAAVLVAIAVPAGLSRLDDRSAPAAPSSLYDLPARGPLADDEAFLADARTLPWTTHDLSGEQLPDPPVATRHVVWAGDVPGGQRWVLVAGQNTAVPQDDDPEHQTDLGAISSIALALFTGPAGTPAGELTLAGLPHGQTADVPFAVQDAGTGTLLVVAAPGDVIEVSDRPVFGADGSQTRSWSDAAGPDGVALLRVDPQEGPGPVPVEYRVFRDRLEVFSVRSPDVIGQTPHADLVLATVHGPLLAPPDAQYAAAELVAALGLAPGEPAATIAWQGSVPGPDDGGAPATVTVATATAPSGAVLVRTLWTRPVGDGGAYGGACGERVVLPAGPPAAQRTYAFDCTITDTVGERPASSVVVAAPPGAVLVRMYDGSGAQVAEATLDGGVVVLPDTLTGGQRPAAVEAFTADGTSLGRAALLGEGR